jgi:hypothetical protein
VPEVSPPPDRSQELGTFLRSRMQPYRADILLGCRSVKVVRRGGQSTTETDPRIVVNPGDSVFIADPLLAPCAKALDSIPSTTFRDYAFVPGSRELDMLFGDYFEYRPQTTRLKPPEGTLRAFARLVRDSAQQPVRNLYLASHSWLEGELNIRLNLGSPVGFITFEDLLQAKASRELDLGQALSPRPRDAKGAKEPASVHIRGCRLGRAQPFLRALQECFGPGIARVTAPLHFNAVAEYGTVRGKRDGVVEYMVYGLQLNRRARFGTRPEAVREFSTSGLRDIAGNAFDWNAWIPANPNEDGRRGTTTNINHPLAGGPVPVPWSYTVRLNRLLFPVHIGPQPTNLKARPKADSEKKKAALDILSKEPVFQESHAYPVFRRVGHATLAEMIEGWNWVFSEAQGRIMIQGMRQEYTLLLPVKDPKTGLLLNFFPKPGSPLRPLIQLKEDDKRFFASFPP